jgi:hypothetical protein
MQESRFRACDKMSVPLLEKPSSGTHDSHFVTRYYSFAVLLPARCTLHLGKAF